MVKREIAAAVIATMPQRIMPLVQLKVCCRISHQIVTPTTHRSSTPVKMEKREEMERYFSGRGCSTLHVAMVVPPSTSGEHLSTLEISFVVRSGTKVLSARTGILWGTKNVLSAGHHAVRHFTQDPGIGRLRHLRVRG